MIDSRRICHLEFSLGSGSFETQDTRHNSLDSRSKTQDSRLGQCEVGGFCKKQDPRHKTQDLVSVELEISEIGKSLGILLTDHKNLQDRASLSDVSGGPLHRLCVNLDSYRDYCDESGWFQINRPISALGSNLSLLLLFLGSHPLRRTSVLCLASYV